LPPLERFRQLGLCRGERVALYLEKRPETVAATFGAACAGGVFVPVNLC
jgi:acyl-CoA synthetase (AMP-forming)/AMP-acid ligase II